MSDDECFFALTVDALRREANRFRPVFDATEGCDGWVSMEVSPLLADGANATILAVAEVCRRAQRAILFVKIPGTQADVAVADLAGRLQRDGTAAFVKWWEHLMQRIAA